MSDTVKLIIEIPKSALELLNTTGVDWLDAEHILSAVAQGIPLDDVTTEIKKLKHQYTDISGYRWWNNAIDNCLNEIRNACDIESEK